MLTRNYPPQSTVLLRLAWIQVIARFVFIVASPQTFTQTIQPPKTEYELQFCLLITIILSVSEKLAACNDINFLLRAVRAFRIFRALNLRQSSLSNLVYSASTVYSVVRRQVSKPSNGLVPQTGHVSAANFTHAYCRFLRRSYSSPYFAFRTRIREFGSGSH